MRRPVTLEGIPLLRTNEVAVPFAAPLSKLLARLHLWYPAAVVLAQEPLAMLDTHSIGRLSYALMMSNRMRRGSADALFQRILQDNQDRSAELSISLAEMAARIQQPMVSERLLQDAVRLCDNAFSQQAAECLLHTAQALQDGSLQAHVRGTVEALRLDRGERVVLVPLSSLYQELFHLWLQQVRRHAAVRVVVLAMDSAALSLVTDQPDLLPVDAGKYFAWGAAGKLQAQTRGVLWLLRTLYLRELVCAGHLTLVLDCDAMLVGDVWQMLSAFADCDVVAQQDHSLPVDVDRQIGFVLCCGFMMWRPTPAAQALLDRFVAAVAIERDDQMALNHLISNDGVVDKQQHPQGMRFASAGATFACPSPSLVSRSLKSGSVVRHFHQRGQGAADLRRALGV